MWISPLGAGENMNKTRLVVAVARRPGESHQDTVRRLIETLKLIWRNR